MFRRANLDGTEVETIISEQLTPNYLALHIPAGQIYWTDYSSEAGLQRSNLDGTGVETIVEGPFLWGVALDIGAGKMYIVHGSSGQGGIGRCDLDGTNIEILASALGEIKGIEVYPNGGKVYWVDNDLGKIVRSDLDGANVTDIVTGLDSPEYIALDPIEKKVYWTLSSAAAPNNIQRANLDGSVVEDLPITGSMLKGIALDIRAGKLYWSEWGSDKIRRANLGGTGIEDLVVSGLYAPQGLALTVSNPTTIIDDLIQAAVLQQNFPNPFQSRHDYSIYPSCKTIRFTDDLWSRWQENR